MTADYSEATRTGFAVVIAALREDDNAIWALLQGITHEETAAVCHGSISAMAALCREVLTDQTIRNMISDLQQLALTEGGTGG